MNSVVTNISNYVSNVRRVTAHRSFRRLLVASFVSGLGDQLGYLAFLAAVSAGSEDVYAIGGISVAEMFAGLIALPLVQIIIDRYDKRRMLLVADLARAVIFILAAMANELWLYFVCGFCAAAFTQLFDPSRSALEPHYIPDGQIVQANGFRQSLLSLVMILGLAIGGLLIGTMGFRIAFLINAASFLFSAALVIDLERVTTTQRDSHRFVDEISGGLRAVRGNPTLMFLFILMGSFHLAVGMQFPLIFVYIREAFGGGTRELSWLISSMGIGGIVGGLLMSQLPKERHPFDISKRRGKVNIAVIALLDGGVLMTFTSLHGLVPMVFMFGLFGVIGSAFYVGITTAITEHTDDEHRGRVFSLYSAQRGPALMLSVIIGVPIAKSLGSGPVLVGSGGAEVLIGLIAIVVAGKIRSPKMLMRTMFSL